MFCLGCGAEVASRSSICGVCGRDVGGAGGQAWSHGREAESVVSVTRPAPSTPSAVPVDASGFPQDWLGRILLFAVVGLAADMLLPWSDVYGQRQAISHLGAPAWALVGLFALAAMPIVRPSYRREPLISALPLLVGTFCAGIGVMYWVLLYRENQQASAIPNVLPPDSTALVSSVGGAVIAPDVGLYVFLLGCVALAAVGYQLFLAATSARNAGARQSAQVAVRAPSSSHPNIVQDAVRPPAAGSVESNAQNGHAPTRSLPAASETAALQTKVVGSNVVLPGSDAWNIAPRQPVLARHTGAAGWQRPRGKLR